MRRLVLLVQIFMLASWNLHAQTQKSIEQVRVEQTITEFFDRLAALDTKGMHHFGTSDFLLLEDGAIWNMDTLVNKLSPLKAAAFSRTNHFNFIQTEVKGATAWVAYNNTADMIVNGRQVHVEWLESAVLVKDGKEWKIRLLHSTPLKPKAN